MKIRFCYSWKNNIYNVISHIKGCGVSQSSSHHDLSLFILQQSALVVKRFGAMLFGWLGPQESKLLVSNWVPSIQWKFPSTFLSCNPIQKRSELTWKWNSNISLSLITYMLKLNTTHTKTTVTVNEYINHR